MATLITGQSQLLTLQPSDKYTVTVGANTEAYIDLGAGTDGSGYDSVRLTSEGTNMYTIGEYGRVAKVTIRCVVGSVDYSLKCKKEDCNLNNGTLVTDWQTDGVLAKVSSNSGESVALDSSMPINGKPSLKCLTTTGTYTVDFTFNTQKSLAYFNTLDLQMFMPYGYGQTIGGGVVQVWLFLEDDTSVRPQFTTTTLSPNGWVTISYARDGIYNGATPVTQVDAMKVKKVRILVTAGAQSGPFWLGELRVNQRKQRGQILIYADGQYDSQRDYLLPLLDRYGLKANLALTWKDIGQAGRMSYADLDAVNANGHALINHTYGNASTGWDNATDWPNSASIANSLNSAWGEMQNRGWSRGIGHQVVGFTSGWDFGTSDVVKKKIYDGLIDGGCKSIRQGSSFLASAGGVGALTGVQDEALPFKMIYGGIQVTSTHSSQNIKNVIDAAERRGNVGVILFHRLVANSATPASLEMRISEAANALEYLADRVRIGGLLNSTVDAI